MDQGKKKKMKIFTCKDIKNISLPFILVLQRSHSQNTLGLMVVSLYGVINVQLVGNCCHPLVVADIYFLSEII